MNKINTYIQKYNYIFTIILFLLSAIFMYNGYKALSGFIANGFRDGFKVFTIALCYFLPPICFYFYFYDNHIKGINKIVKFIYSSIIIIIELFIIIKLFTYLNLYLSNNKLGAYDAMLSIGFKFPIDGLLVSFVLIIIQIFNLTALFNNKLSNFKDNFKNYNIVKASSLDFFIQIITSVIAFVFIGAEITGFKAIENILYDIKYLYLLLLILLPLMNLIIIMLKKNIIYDLIAFIINIVFVILLILFEGIYPSFMVNIAKPLFAITFSISMPIEMIMILYVIILSTIIYIIKFIKHFINK